MNSEISLADKISIEQTKLSRRSFFWGTLFGAIGLVLTAVSTFASIGKPPPDGNIEAKNPLSYFIYILLDGARSSIPRPPEIQPGMENSSVSCGTGRKQVSPIVPFSKSPGSDDHLPDTGNAQFEFTQLDNEPSQVLAAELNSRSVRLQVEFHAEVPIGQSGGAVAKIFDGDGELLCMQTIRSGSHDVSERDGKLTIGFKSYELPFCGGVLPVAARKPYRLSASIKPDGAAMNVVLRVKGYDAAIVQK